MSRGVEVDDVGFCFLEGSPSETWAACLRDTCFPVVFESHQWWERKSLHENVGCLIALGESPKRFCKRESLCFDSVESSATDFVSLANVFSLATNVPFGVKEMMPW